MIQNIISERAFSSMLSEIQRYPYHETGGVLIGIKDKDNFYIIEAVESGIHAIHEVGRLSCDMHSINYMVRNIIDLYEQELYLIGVWHKHNNIFNPPFSQEDMDLYKKLYLQYQQDIVSILFQKNSDGNYIMNMYRYTLEDKLVKEEFEVKDISKNFPYKNWI